MSSLQDRSREQHARPFNEAPPRREIEQTVSLDSCPVILITHHEISRSKCDQSEIFHVDRPTVATQI